MLKGTVLATLLAFTQLGFATTWGTTTVPDPVNEKETCEVAEPASSGSYIYSWPGKYEQVFWPVTEQNGIWFCQKSGFTAFIGDFDDISASERKAITAYLAANFKGEATIEDKLALLAGIYALRNKGELFRNRLLRVLAYWYEDLGNAQRASGLRKEALKGILSALDGKLSEQRRLEYMYVACNYHRYFGAVEASESCVNQLKVELAASKDEKLKDFVSYLSELLSETPKIKPGTKLNVESDS